LEVDSDRSSGEPRTFTEEEEEEFIRMSQMPDLYDTFSKSIAPSIYGNAGWFIFCLIVCC
jgi:DNA replication licensing factor MCM5